MQSASPPAYLPRGIVTGIFLRSPGTAGTACFQRRPHTLAAPAVLSRFGLEGSEEWHRLENNAGRLSTADAADRALLMQVINEALILHSRAFIAHTLHRFSVTRMPEACCNCPSVASRLQSRPKMWFRERSAKIYEWRSARAARGTQRRCA
jgi:hypothetical protein